MAAKVSKSRHSSNVQDLYTLDLSVDAPPGLPGDAIEIETYAELRTYLKKFASGQLNLLLLLGRPGTGKTQAACQAFASGSIDRQMPSDHAEKYLYIEGHAQPFGLYECLWRNRDIPVILDDLDRLYSHADSVRLLKALCKQQRRKQLSWISRATQGDDGVPDSFETTSNVLLIANEWKSLNSNVHALEDRAIVLYFNPSNTELHRYVAQWFDDTDVFGLLESMLPLAQTLSIRHYEKGRMLKLAGFPDWRHTLLRMLLPDRRLALVLALQMDPELKTDMERVERFRAETGQSRPTYYRIKRSLPKEPAWNNRLQAR